MRLVLNKFNFWKNNRINEHFVLTLDQAKEQFKIFLSKKSKAWLDYYSVEAVIATFIAEKEEKGGLQSSNEPKEFEAFYRGLKDCLLAHMQQGNSFAKK
jgi:hypothetical protein